MSNKKKSLIKIPIIILAMLFIFYLRFYFISEKFTALEGMKSIISILNGKDIIEFEGNEENTIIMAKSNEEGLDCIFSYLEGNGYKDLEQMGSAILSNKNGEEKVFILEMYTKNYFITEIK